MRWGSSPFLPTGDPQSLLTAAEPADFLGAGSEISFRPQLGLALVYQPQDHREDEEEETGDTRHPWGPSWETLLFAQKNTSYKKKR